VPSAPSGLCLEVEALGTVQVIVLPLREAAYDIQIEGGCDVRFVEPGVVGAR
jgi:hypothetical protein